MIRRAFDFDCLPISRVYVTRIHAYEIQSFAVVLLYSWRSICVYMYYTCSILGTIMVFGFTEIIVTSTAQSFGYNFPRSPTHFISLKPRPEEISHRYRCVFDRFELVCTRVSKIMVDVVRTSNSCTLLEILWSRNRVPIFIVYFAGGPYL